MDMLLGLDMLRRHQVNLPDFPNLIVRIFP